MARYRRQHKNNVHFKANVVWNVMYGKRPAGIPDAGCLSAQSRKHSTVQRFYFNARYEQKFHLLLVDSAIHECRTVAYQKYPLHLKYCTHIKSVI